MTTYKIVRYYQDRTKSPRLIKSGLTLAEARAHCANPETSTRTCQSLASQEHQRHGSWFDGYRKEYGHE